MAGASLRAELPWRLRGPAPAADLSAVRTPRALTRRLAEPTRACQARASGAVEAWLPRPWHPAPLAALRALPAASRSRPRDQALRPVPSRQVGSRPQWLRLR